MTLLHRRGYNRQHIVDGAQVDSESPWVPESSLRDLQAVVSVTTSQAVYRLHVGTDVAGGRRVGRTIRRATV